MIWWGIGFYLIIILLVLPFKTKATISYSLAQNLGKFELYLWNIKIFEEYFELGFNYIVFKKSGKQSIVRFNDFGKSKFADRFMLSLVKMMKVNTIKSDIMLGIEGDSFYTNILAGMVLSLENSLLAVISTKKKIKVLRAVVLQTNLKSDANVKFSFSITICLLQLLISAIFALCNKKGENYGKQSS